MREKIFLTFLDHTTNRYVNDGQLLLERLGNLENLLNTSWSKGLRNVYAGGAQQLKKDIFILKKLVVSEMKVSQEGERRPQKAPRENSDVQ